MSTTYVISLRTKTKPMLTVIALIGFVIMIVNTQSTFAVALINKGGLTNKTHRLAQERIEAELVTIRPTGFDPVEIRRPRGRFILAVNNRSGIHELDLRLDREMGARQHEVRLPRGRPGWKKIVDLPPGRYILTEANHPNWICRITITLP